MQADNMLQDSQVKNPSLSSSGYYHLLFNIIKIDVCLREMECCLRNKFENTNVDLPLLLCSL